ncbi:hypothetical protein ElyMa_006651200 [Elysia marginata]|uniref:Reverse transcriptase domain-containing protein n=1 Tax=Elysia marginata TaxID=1093978 RepID=A0AAV4IK49_9GAST|nr:hypothetical protein ElyMa_006651200 [Elysia marginata]
MSAKLLRMIMSFDDDMMGTVQFDGLFSDPFPIKSGVKQGCVLAHMLFGIFFSLLLRYAFHESEDDIFLQTRSEYNLLRLRAKTKVHQVLIREMLVADDAALAIHCEECLYMYLSHASRMYSENSPSPPA